LFSSEDFFCLLFDAFLFLFEFVFSFFSHFVLSTLKT
jgi:hypothetical protein